MSRTYQGIDLSIYTDPRDRANMASLHNWILSAAPSIPGPTADDAGMTAVGAAPNSATYVLISAHVSLSNARRLAVSNGIGLTDGGAGSTVTLDGDAMLRSNTSDAFTSGTLTINSGTTLNVAGTLQIGGANVTSTAAELNKLNGAGATVTAANLTTLTNGSNADALHVHTASGVTGFLLDTGDTGTGTYTLTAATPLYLNNTAPTIQWGGGAGGSETLTFTRPGSFPNVETTTFTFLAGRAQLILDSGASVDTLFFPSAIFAGRVRAASNLQLQASSTLKLLGSNVEVSTASYFDFAATPTRINTSVKHTFGTSQEDSIEHNGTHLLLTPTTGVRVESDLFWLTGIQDDDTGPITTQHATFDWGNQDAGSITVDTATLTFEAQSTATLVQTTNYIFTASNNTAAGLTMQLTKSGSAILTAGGTLAFSGTAVTFNATTTGLNFSAASGTILFNSTSNDVDISINAKPGGTGRSGFVYLDSNLGNFGIGGNGAWPTAMFHLQHKAQTISAERHQFYLDQTNSFTVDTNTTNLRYARFAAPTVSISTGVTVTTAATVAIGGPPTNSGLGTLTLGVDFWLGATAPKILVGSSDTTTTLAVIGSGTGGNDALITLKNSDGSTKTLTLSADTGAAGVTSDGNFVFNGGANALTFNCGSANFNISSTLGFFGATPVAQASAYTPTNVTTDRAYDANATSTDELADVLGTLIADLQLYGLLQ